MTKNIKSIPAPPGVTVQFVRITPADALDILENNVNRPVRSSRVKEYAAIMGKGEWQFNGDTVVIDKNNVLRDGQHRLEGCILSKKDLDVVLITGVEPKSQTTMDLGARRTVADTLALAGYGHPKMLASSIGLVHMWETQGHLHRSGIMPLTPNNAVETVRRHEDIARYVKMVSDDPLKTAPAPSSFIAAIYLISRAVKNHGTEERDKKFEDFLDGTIKGFGLNGAFDARLQLRNRFQRIKDNDPGRDNDIASSVAWLTIRAWEAWVDDEEVVKFQIGGGPDFTFAKSIYWRDIPEDTIRLSRATDDMIRRAGRKIKPVKTAKTEAKKQQKVAA